MPERDSDDLAVTGPTEAPPAIDITVGGARRVEEPHPPLDNVDAAAAHATSELNAESRQPADSQSLWWPDRNAQVVQATTLSPQAAAAFLRSSPTQLDDRFRVEAVTEHSPREFEVDARLVVRPTGWRRVVLRIYATPSGNLTVIEMLPRRAWMPQTGRYLAAAVPVITGLTDLMEATPRSPDLN